MSAINIKGKNDDLGIIYRLIIFLHFIVVTNATLQNIRMIYWSSIGLIILSIFWYITTSRFKVSSYIIWVFLLFLIITLSTLWAFEKDFAIEGVKSIILTYPIFILLSLIIKDEKDIYSILNIFLLSQLINAIYIIFILDFSTIGVTRVGADSLGDEWNANRIGLLMAFSAFASLNVMKYKKGNLKKTSYLLLVLLFSLFTLITGSRKALMVLLFTIGLFYVFNSENKKVLRLLIVVTSTLSLIYIIMNIPSLYNVLGSRIDGMIAQFTGQGIVDRSTSVRFRMIEYGTELIRNKPFLGYGINNFRPLYGRVTGWYTYSHNNYIEILIGIGVIGAIVYYLSYVYIIRNTLRRKEPLSVFALISVVSIMLIEIGLVSYASFYVQLFICLSFSSIQVTKMTNKDKTLEI